MKGDLVKIDKKLLLVKSRSFEINQRLVRIYENNDVPLCGLHVLVVGCETTTYSLQAQSIYWCSE